MYTWFKLKNTSTRDNMDQTQSEECTEWYQYVPDPVLKMYRQVTIFAWIRLKNLPTGGNIHLIHNKEFTDGWQYTPDS